MKKFKKTKVYKVKSKFRKNPDLLLEHGFNYYEDEDKTIKIYAISIVLNKDNPLFTQCVNFLEQCYESATTEERERDFKDFKFRLELQVDQTNKWRLVLDDDLIQEISQAQICVVFDEEAKDKTLLFINSPLKDYYYSSKLIRETAPEIINKLIKDKVIYEKRYIYN